MTPPRENAPFRPLGQYDWPSLPNDDRLKQAINWLKDAIFRTAEEDGPVVANDHLKDAPSQRLDRIAAPPACGPLVEELDAELQAWMAGGDDKGGARVIILPPCDENDMIAAWAAQNDLSCLAPPSALDICNALPEIPDLAGDGVLVIPRLETWLVRHQSGLGHIRALLSALSGTQRPCIIGCNSWAWAYLSAALSVQLQFPQPMTFHAFDDRRLRDWFAQLSARPETAIEKFRLSTNGRDVFETDEEGAIQSDFFKTLAAQSLGIPWVAWTMWRRSLRQTREVEDEDGIDLDDAQTLWVAALAEFSLPVQHRRSALLVLQSLLIHGPLTAEVLALTVPLVGQTNVVEGLQRAGFVRQTEGKLSCAPAAYPAIRRELSNAGFQMDVL